MLKPRFVTLVGFILFAALLRIVPHPWNFSPVGAMALFGGARFREKSAALLFPLGALFLSDVILGFYPGIWAVYLGFAVMVGIGMAIQKRPGLPAIGAGTLGASVSFFLITNFGWWLPDCHYPRTLQGIVQGYIAGIPFFQNTLLGDAFYVALLFGGFALAEKWFPLLREAPQAAGASAA
jgi:hypothetical protein